jgi:hypothetical protein
MNLHQFFSYIRIRNCAVYAQILSRCYKNDIKTTQHPTAGIIGQNNNAVIYVV